MRINRLFTPQALREGECIELEPDSCRRLSQVLRLRAGAALALFNGDGHEYPSELLESGKRGCRLRVCRQEATESAGELDIELAIGISRGDHMDRAVQKAVELGVNQIQPLLTDHGNQRLSGDWQEKRQRHWQNIIISACEQSGRCRLPQLQPVAEMAQWLSDHDAPAYSLMLQPRGACGLGALTAPACGQSISLLVGPEGGLSPAEIEQATKLGFQSIRLGPRVLRTETAPLAAIAALQALWGDFR